MLPGGLDAAYRQALAGPHQRFVQVEILDGAGTVLESDLVFNSGQVTATLASRVTRQLYMTMHEDLYPYEDTDLLAPHGNMVRAWGGVQFAEGSRYRFPVFWGRIQNASLVQPGLAQVFATDLSQEAVDNRFVQPRNASVDVLVADAVRELIADAYPPARFGTFDAVDIRTHPMTWQLDRAQALDELATSVGAFWYTTAGGEFVLRRYPWTVPGPPVVAYSDSDLVQFSYPHRSRDGVYNSLTVTGERLTGDTPVYATAQDDNPASPTYVGGNFGRRHQLLRLQTPGSQGAAVAAARDNLRRTTALANSWTWDMVPDAALELGDVVLLNARGRSEIQVVEQIQIPLDLDAPMIVHGRSQVVDILDGVA